MFKTVVIENLWPQIEGGLYPIKRTPGESVEVFADIFKEGHDVVLAMVKWRTTGTKKWQESPMTHLGQDRWRGSFPAGPVGFTEWTIESWGDAFGSWVEEIGKKVKGGATSLPSETLEGVALMQHAAKRAGKHADAKRLTAHAELLEKATDPATLLALASDIELVTLMGEWSDSSLATI